MKCATAFITLSASHCHFFVTNLNAKDDLYTRSYKTVNATSETV